MGEVSLVCPSNWQNLSFEEQSVYIKQHLSANEQYSSYSVNENTKRIVVSLIPNWYEMIKSHKDFSLPNMTSVHEAPGVRHYVSLFYYFDGGLPILSFIEHKGNELALERLSDMLNHPYHKYEFRHDAWTIKWIQNKHVFNENVVRKIQETWKNESHDTFKRGDENSLNEEDQLRNELDDLIENDLSDTEIIIYNGGLSLLPVTLEQDGPKNNTDSPTIVTYIFSDNLNKFIQEWY
ncbi:unnamed protein product [Didymodactylos carnosus]|uniref:Uncharacterized protein n=1 Tax=Didymodactylos carnosus TaxID=1234261 RepID=A0A816CXX1_9BILA|nr:unnamed protein product [Didymodactylos carnosus]CAF1626055.1 unnamed protein product [Didymodactylos carnosus]CAF3799394.1 unnamed protein product [Didymodactylos carnosus]CAF4519987.1 unnamed protein product [Didymodactylos carnosus]